MEFSLSVLAPFLLVIGIILIISGAVLAMIYGHVAYQIIYTPQNVPVLNYILGHVPATIPVSSIKGTMGTTPFEIVLPETFTMYSFTFLLFIGFGILLSITRCLIWSGIQIVKSLWKVFFEAQ